MSSISAQNFIPIDDDHKEISLSKETNFKTETETSDAWIAKLQTQKNLNKGDMTKKPDLAQSFQKLITLTKHIFFF
jgi:gamma-glutamyltranspeptidase